MTDLEKPKSPPPGARFADPDNDDYSLKFDLFGDLLPSGKTAKLRAWDGHGERALIRSQSASGPARVDHLVRFLLNVVAELDGATPTEEAILDLADADVRAIRIRARYATHDDTTKVEFSWSCSPPVIPHGLGCGHRGDVTAANGRAPNCQAFDLLDLDFLPIIPASGHQLALAKAKKGAAWFANTLRRQKAYLARARKAVEPDDIDLDALFFSRGLQIDGKEAKQRDLDALHGKDRSDLRREMLKWGGVDSRIRATCNGVRKDGLECGVVLKSVAEDLPGFFFPEMGAE